MQIDTKPVSILIIDSDRRRAIELGTTLTAGNAAVEVTHASSTEEAARLSGPHFDATLFPTTSDGENFSIPLDPLTGLAGRASFEAHLNQKIIRDERFSMLFIDLDGFKGINDRYGHQIGDRVLEEVAMRLQGAVRSRDFCSRWGGDEFTVLLDGDRLPREIACAAQRIVRTISTPMTIGGLILRCSASMGVASYPTDGHDEESLVRAADRAMYRAKFNGGARLRFFDRQLELFEPNTIPCGTSLP